LTKTEIDKSLDQKIEELFDYRAFNELYKLTGEKNSVLAKFHQHLKNLQASIYYLDAYLEENWLLDDDVIETKWQAIYVCLKNMGIKESKHQDYVKHIKKYELHERAIRNGILPDQYSLHYFYFYKSCDVKLMRRLILEHYPVLKSLFTLQDWRIFDLVTEVNDDATDIFEDLATINGNSILIQTLNNGKEIPLKTITDFLNLLEHKNNTYKYSSKKWSEKIKSLTSQNIELTKSVLSINLNNFTSDHKLSARILPHIKTLL
jgi:nuclear transport factor 2 (NTF2) superfamily protein